MFSVRPWPGHEAAKGDKPFTQSNLSLVQCCEQKGRSIPPASKNLVINLYSFIYIPLCILLYITSSIYTPLFICIYVPLPTWRHYWVQKESTNLQFLANIVVFQSHIQTHRQKQHQSTLEWRREGKNMEYFVSFKEKKKNKIRLFV